MAGKKKTMGRGLGSLLERRTTTTSQPVQSKHKQVAEADADSKAASANQPAQPTLPKNESNQAADTLAVTNTVPEVSSSEQPPSKSSIKTSQFTNAHDADKTADQANAEPALQSAVQVATPTGDKLRLLGIDQIKRGIYQPRRHFDAELLQELADSLKSEGLIQPILVRADGQGNYELIAGERRWRAAQLAGFTEIPSIVRDLDDRAVAAVSLIENIQRKDLNPLEEAEALRRLSDEFGLSHQSVAEAVGRSRSAVTNLMRLLDLHEDAKALVDEGKIDMGHARALLGAPLDDQATIARRIVKEGLTVRAVEKQIKAFRSGVQAKPDSAAVVDPDIDRLEKHLTEKLGAKVSIRHKTSGSGKLEISYHSMDELDGILNYFK